MKVVKDMAQIVLNLVLSKQKTLGNIQMWKHDDSTWIPYNIGNWPM